MATEIEEVENGEEYQTESGRLKVRLLSELTMDESADVLIQITEPLLEIMTDEDIKEAFRAELGAKATKAEIERMGIIKFGKLVSAILGKKRDVFYRAVAPFFGVDAEDIHGAKLFAILGGLFKIWKDRDFQNFLAELRDGGAK